MPIHANGKRLVSTIGLIALCAQTSTAGNPKLEEITVTAQKREQSLQDVPIALSVLDSRELETLKINSVATLGSGIIPSLSAHPYGNSNSIQVVMIRGNGSVDVAPITREPSVAVHLDGIYLGRTQGLSTEVADPERIEVLRGPQGTLFGRNATGGAINIISKAPTGVFGFDQRIGFGSNNAKTSVTHLNLPELAGIRARLDYLLEENDGWVTNSAAGENNYNARRSRAGRAAFLKQVGDSISLGYAYDFSNMDTTQPYFQMYRDYGQQIGDEKTRRSKTRFPVKPLDWTQTRIQGHAFTASWDINPSTTLKSLTGYRRLNDDNRGNFAGALYYNGFIPWTNLRQTQFSQEFQLTGTAGRFEYVSGIFLLRENARQETRTLFSLDEFGIMTGVPFTPIPVTDIDLFTGQAVPPQTVHMDVESKALYGQVTWTPPLLDDHLQVTVGGRYSGDHKSGNRIDVDYKRFTIDTSHFDPLAVLDYQWTPALSTYLKWGTAYQSGGTNPVSVSFRPFGNEKVTTTELGMKSELWGSRARINADVFKTRYDGMQLDFNDPNHPVTVTETINAARTSSVSGAELELLVTPFKGLVVGLNYTYLDGDMPLQPNPLLGNALQKFETTQTPTHAGSVTLDYTLATALGNLGWHLDIVSSSDFAYVTLNNQRWDSRTLVNGRISLSDIAVGSRGRLQLAWWGRNLTDESYVTFAFPVNQPPVAIIQAFGEPRSTGVDIKYSFN